MDFGNLEKLSGDKLLTYIFLILCLILPGFGYLHLTNDNYFQKLDFVRLIILSIFYSTPLFLMAFAGVISHEVNNPRKTSKKRKSAEEDEFLELILLSSFTSLLYFFGSLLLYFFINFLLSISWISYLTNVQIHLAYFVYGFAGFMPAVEIIKNIIKSISKK